MSGKKCLISLIGMAVALSFMQHAKAQIVQWRIEDGGNGHYYEAVCVPEGLTWEEANSAATTAGGYLVTTTSQAENTFVFGLVKDDTKYWRHRYVSRPFYIGPWLGGFQYPETADPAANWQWVTGEPWDFTFWCPEFPIIPDDELGDQNRLHFLFESGGWNDLESPNPTVGNPVAYIVEWDSPVDMLWGLVKAVGDINLAQGISNALDGKLDTAIDALLDANQNNDVAACNALEAFVNHCEAQSGNKLTQDQADYLIGRALEIIAVLRGV